MARLDHLVFGAPTLEAGNADFERRLGVALPAGGLHPRMGTHNRLTRIAPATFVEIIAIDPDAAAPDRPRWFGLDATSTRMRLEVGLALLTWVVAVEDLDLALDQARVAGVDAGQPVEQIRGDLRWRIALSRTGSLIEGGTFPCLIEWPPGIDAAARMPDVGVRLERLRITHETPKRLEAALGAIGAGGLAEVASGPSGLVVTLSYRDRAVSF